MFLHKHQDIEILLFQNGSMFQDNYISLFKFAACLLSEAHISYKYHPENFVLFNNTEPPAASILLDISYFL